MSKSRLYLNVIHRMHKKLNILIAESQFDLQADKVLMYSRKLDRVLKKYFHSQYAETSNSK